MFDQAIPIVGRFFALPPSLFALKPGVVPETSLSQYIDGLNLARWKPSFVVLHNTGNPDLAMRPDGFDTQQMRNLACYYASLHWHAGPHFFVDQHGAWAFSDPERPGVHSPSWNAISWGVEMLGDYDRDDFLSGDGARVAERAIYLLACLHRRAGLPSGTLRFHKEDPLTTHKDCPGRTVVKESVVQRLHDRLAGEGAVR